MWCVPFSGAVGLFNQLQTQKSSPAQRMPAPDRRYSGGAAAPADFSTAAVWCVPFSGTVGLFNQLQTQQQKAVWCVPLSGAVGLWLELRGLPQILFLLQRRGLG